MSQEVTKWLGSVGYTPNSSPIYKGVITHLLTIDPNFQRDIQVAGKSTINESMYFRLNDAWIFLSLVMLSVLGEGMSCNDHISHRFGERISSSSQLPLWMGYVIVPGYFQTLVPSNTTLTKTNIPSDFLGCHGVSKPPVWRPQGVTRRIWCFHRRGREP